MVIWNGSNSCKLRLYLIQLVGWQRAFFSPIYLPWAKLNNSVYYLYSQLLYYTELYNCSQLAADLVKFDVNNSCTAAISYFDEGHCYWMPLKVETIFSLKQVRAGYALQL